jgi:hypothetical protein
MYAGLGLTVVAVIVAYVDHATANLLAGHIRAGYPAYTQARVDSAVTIYLVYLSVIGALGLHLLAAHQPFVSGRIGLAQRGTGCGEPQDRVKCAGTITSRRCRK